MSHVTEKILDLVKAEHRPAFIRFLETGELDPDFEHFLDTDLGYQEAVEIAIDMQIKALQDLVRRDRDRANKGTHERENTSVEVVTATLGTAVNAATNLTEDGWSRVEKRIRETIPKAAQLMSVFRKAVASLTKDQSRQALRSKQVKV